MHRIRINRMSVFAFKVWRKTYKLIKKNIRIAHVAWININYWMEIPCNIRFVIASWPLQFLYYSRYNPWQLNPSLDMSNGYMAKFKGFGSLVCFLQYLEIESGDACMCKQTKPILIQIMACLLFGANALHGLILDYCMRNFQWHWNKNSCFFVCENNWNWRLWNSGSFCGTRLCEPVYRFCLHCKSI